VIRASGGIDLRITTKILVIVIVVIWSLSTMTAAFVDMMTSTISVVRDPHSDPTTNPMIVGEAGLLQEIRHATMVLKQMEGTRDPMTAMVRTHETHTVLTNGGGVEVVIEKATGEVMNIENDVEMIPPTNQEAETRNDVHKESQMAIVADITEKKANEAKTKATTKIGKGTTNAMTATMQNAVIVMRGGIIVERDRNTNRKYDAEP
jgi:uncharacterized protein GlcG (DUF336 family)